MSKEKSFRASITGIDGAGKDTVSREVVIRASADFNRVIKLGRPSYEHKNGEMRQIFKRTTESMDRMHMLADRMQSRRLIVAANAANVLMQSRVLENLVANQEPSPDVIISSRDPRLDPAVYFSYYAPSAISSKVDIARRLRTVQRLTGVSRDLIILLKIDPRVAVERIENRIHNEAIEKIETGNQSAGMRDKWRHMHENVDDLGMLGRGYDVAIEELAGVIPTRIVEIDTTEKPSELVADIAYYALLQSINGNIAPGERIELREAA